MGVNSLALTGVPGWFSQAFLDDLSNVSRDGISDVRALVHPGQLSNSGDLIKRNPIIASVHPLELAHPESPVTEQDLRGVDVLVHCAAVIHVRRTADWYRINTEGTLRLANAARAAGVRRFVFMSSNAVGGRCESENQVLDESLPPRPLSHYGRSKWLAEQGLMQMHNTGDFEVVILRPSMFYGPPVPDRHVDIYRRIISGRMPIVGGGVYRRSITYIDNLIQATKLAISHPAAAGEAFYVVDEPIYTTRTITEMMAQALSVPLRVLSLPGFVGEVAYRTDRLLATAGIYWQDLHLVGESHWHVALSCDKIKKTLGYAPKVELAEGMRRAVSWCRSQGKL
jgi:nucleoside-diphosphate-sugar epimerase